MDELKVNGHPITIDLSKVTHKEYIHFWTETASDEEKSDFFLKVCGLTTEQIEGLTELDWRRFRAAFRAACFETTETAEKN